MERKLIQQLILLVFCSVLVLPVAAVTNGKIAFVSDRFGINEIFVMNADGSDQTNLTPNQAVGTSPAWSPDGTKIAFRSSDSKIYVMNADGSEKICLTPDIPGGAPLWSPDGNKIAYLAGQHDIYILNADGSGYNALWISGEKNNNLGWSPDSTKIVFNCGYYHTIWVMGADGSNPTHLGHDGQDSGWQYQSPSWSPDGIKIAFQVTDFPNSEIFVVNADWTGRTNLTRNTADDSRPSWSPDGTKIAYYSNVPEGYCNIYVMNPDGSGQTRLASPICSDYVSPYDSSSWSPDSTKIVFTYTPMDSNTEIYVVNADDKGQKQLTFEGNNVQPSWGKGIANGHDGTIIITPSTNTDPNENAQIIVIDPDLNTDHNKQETIEVHLESWYMLNNIDHLSEISTITLQEQSPNSYTFNTTIHFDTVEHPGFGPEYVSVHPYYPGKINVTYIDALDSKGNTDVERTAGADYLFGYNVTITSSGKFVNSPNIVETQASVPLIVTVKDGDEPVRGAEIYLNDESATSFLTLSLGQTDINGNLTCDILLDEINETNIVGKPITVYAEKSEEKRGLSQPFVAVEKTKKFSNPKILTTGDVALYTTFALIIHQIEGLFDIVSNVEVWIVDKCLSANGVHFFSETYTMLTTYAYWAHEMNYHPTTGDKLDLVGYNYTAHDVLTAYRLDLIIYPRVDPSNVIKRSYWVNSENTGHMTIAQILHILRITIRSPAVVYVTAPDGTHAGYDPQTGQLVQEFPCFISEPGDEPFLMYIPTDQIGEYRIDVVGTGSGSYTMTADVFDENMIIQKSATYTQLTNTGTITSYKINLPESGDIVISPDNQRPDLVNPGDQTLTEGKTLSLDLLATDPDNDPLTYTFTPTLAGASISGNTFTWTPGPGTAGKYPVKFIVTDTGGLSDEEAINITVNAPITNVPTNVKIVPKIINIGSKGYFLSFVTLPETYKGATIDMKTVSCSGAPAVRMMKLKLFPRIVGFVFKTSDLQNVGVGNKVTLNVKGDLKNNGKTYTFTGADSIKVISKPTWQPDDIKDISKESDDQLFKKYST